MTVLSISKDSKDHDALREILSAPEIRVESVDSTKAVVTFVDRAMMIFCDDSEDWRGLLALDPRPCVVVASRVADNRMWSEALNLGAHDLVAKPLDAEEVRRILKFVRFDRA